MFSNQPGSTELEQYINFLNSMRSNYTRFDTTTINGQKLIIVVEPGAFQIFNIDKEKIEECEIQYSPNTIEELSDDLSDLGFDI